MFQPQTSGPGWSGRVRFEDSETPFAYVPDVFLAPDDQATRRVIERLLPDATAEPSRRGAKVPESVTDGPLSAVHWQRWRWVGGALSAVRTLRSAGIELAQPVHVLFADGVQANPVRANPVRANPVRANPVRANAMVDACGQPIGCCCDPVHDQVAESAPVWPSPTMARELLADPDAAARYRATGDRRSQAQAVGVSSPEGIETFTATPDWAKAPVRVAVLDSGFDERLAGAVASRPDLRSDPVDAADVDQDGWLDPVSGHGSFIAGLIHRVAPSAAISVQQVVTSFGDGQEDVIAHHLDALSELDLPPHIVNLSFSGYALDLPNCLRSAIIRANAAGIVVVASAGNDGIDRPAYPAAFPEVIAVAALDRTGPASFSNFGPWVDACAPGTDVVSWFFEFAEHPTDDDQYARTYDRWASWSGTSFAAPVVSGALARAVAAGLSPAAAVATVIDQPGLLRLPLMGTVVNVLGASGTFVW